MAYLLILSIVYSSKIISSPSLPLPSFPHHSPTAPPPAFTTGLLYPPLSGSASHFGVLIDRPTVGVAKKLYHVDGLEKSPRHKQKIAEVLKRRHDTFELIGDSGAILGVALRTGNDARNPVYVSVGHRFLIRTKKNMLESHWRIS